MFNKGYLDSMRREMLARNQITAIENCETRQQAIALHNLMGKIEFSFVLRGYAGATIALLATLNTLRFTLYSRPINFLIALVTFFVAWVIVDYIVRPFCVKRIRSIEVKIHTLLNSDPNAKMAMNIIASSHEDYRSRALRYLQN